jgi:hypothetical protein
VLVGAPGEVAGILASIGVIGALVALGFIVFLRREKSRAAHQDWVFRNGVRGRATVVEAGSHATVNEMPLMKMVLDLDVAGMERRQVTRRQVMSVFAARRLQPGLVLPVYLNPQNPEDLVLVW